MKAVNSLVRLLHDNLRHPLQLVGGDEDYVTTSAENIQQARAGAESASSGFHLEVGWNAKVVRADICTKLVVAAIITKSIPILAHCKIMSHGLAGARSIVTLFCLALWPWCWTIS